MKAVYIKRYGSADELKIGDFTQPKVNEKDVLVKIHASAVNPVDWKLRQGNLKFVTSFKFPMKLGKDFAGEVVETGTAVTLFKAGDRVWGQLGGTNGGAYAEFVAAPEKSMGIMPRNLSYKEAASIPLAGLTAFQSLYNKASVKKGDKVLINGASGGVGTLAVQIAAALGAEVTGVCSGKNTEFVKTLGATHTINYKEEDFSKSDKKYDVILEFVGNVSFGECKKVLAAHGTYVTANPKPLGFLPGYVSSFFSKKQQKLIVVKPSIEELNFLKALVEDGQLKPVIDSTYSLADIAEAHRYSEKGHSRGKIVIEVVKEG
ncbi:NAD(P)-dependent alcohol dehydrogenase [Marivirga sp. S37H4]|uniref:NAD(P)-dependent alcohol dehydrogenase n=1 Tax=Marivirga aurantiaca TaxID=2802615 RepID=A0A934WXZ2_9BACT|nr:NAD(P)-dependent alcohol dehydrogenase [Marivirga aurantiaca]MBK6265214.1 NAD(P)-dependent alcohol dehydrogenase [Marivirga aurantiaca]